MSSAHPDIDIAFASFALNKVIFGALDPAPGPLFGPITRRCVGWDFFVSGGAVAVMQCDGAGQVRLSGLRLFQGADGHRDTVDAIVSASTTERHIVNDADRYMHPYQDWVLRTVGASRFVRGNLPNQAAQLQLVARHLQSSQINVMACGVLLESLRQHLFMVARNAPRFGIEQPWSSVVSAMALAYRRASVEHPESYGVSGDLGWVV